MIRRDWPVLGRSVNGWLAGCAELSFMGFRFGCDHGRWAAVGAGGLSVRTKLARGGMHVFAMHVINIKLITSANNS